jgi:hypothetical protein
VVVSVLFFVAPIVALSLLISGVVLGLGAGGYDDPARVRRAAAVLIVVGAALLAAGFACWAQLMAQLS